MHPIEALHSICCCCNGLGFDCMHSTPDSHSFCKCCNGLGYLRMHSTEDSPLHCNFSKGLDLLSSGINATLLSPSFYRLNLGNDQDLHVPTSLNRRVAVDGHLFPSEAAVAAAAILSDQSFGYELEQRAGSIPSGSFFNSLFLAELPAMAHRELIDLDSHSQLLEEVMQRQNLNSAQGFRQPLKRFARRYDDGISLETTLLRRKPGYPKKLVPRKLSDAAYSSPLQISGKSCLLEEMDGRIFEAAKDQHGCRFLQKRLDEGYVEDIQKIFLEVHPYLIELMTDPFGNYLVQKLMGVCNNDQFMQILQVVTTDNHLVNISLNMHGTRAAQKLIETLRTPDQVAMLVSSLKPAIVILMKDLNGNHVAQHCLQYLSSEDNEFIYGASVSHCVEIASHRHGCCVLQRCVEFASVIQRHRLVAEIASHALKLSQDPFGNYVVQFVLGRGIPWASSDIISRLKGSYPLLAMQKFSSNVVEKCLNFATDDEKECIILEIVMSVFLGELLQDPFANYVIQAALRVTQGSSLHATLVEAIRPYVPSLRSSPYGKRILSRTHLKK